MSLRKQFEKEMEQQHGLVWRFIHHHSGGFEESYIEWLEQRLDDMKSYDLAFEINSELFGGDEYVDEEDVRRVQKILEQGLMPVVVGQSEQYTCECKVCGKPFDNNEDYYRHYDEEHN